jgi:hypothetical protein
MIILWQRRFDAEIQANTGGLAGTNLARKVTLVLRKRTIVVQWLAAAC